MTATAPARATKPAGAGPSPRLVGFLSNILESVRSGDLGRGMAVDMIRAYSVIHAADHQAKAAALRALAGG